MYNAVCSSKWRLLDRLSDAKPNKSISIPAFVIKAESESLDVLSIVGDELDVGATLPSFVDVGDELTGGEGPVVWPALSFTADGVVDGIDDGSGDDNSEGTDDGDTDGNTDLDVDDIIDGAILCLVVGRYDGKPDDDTKGFKEFDSLGACLGGLSITGDVDWALTGGGDGCFVRDDDVGGRNLGLVVGSGSVGGLVSIFASSLLCGDSSSS